MIRLTIDGEQVLVPEGTTILEAARKLNVDIPTLCHHEDQAIKAVCRICVVEVAGNPRLPTACNTPVEEGMVVKTASPVVLKARRNIMELILARHPQNCLICTKSGSCELQKVARNLNMYQPNRYELQLRKGDKDLSSLSIVRDMNRCILCGRCVESCSNVQGIGVMAKENRGFDTVVTPPYGKKLVDTPCVNCGQCVQVCPVGALGIRENTTDIYDRIEAGDMMVIQIAPSVRITLAESLGAAPGTVSTGKIIHALKKIGFYKVFDSDFTADLTIMEEGNELLKRLEEGRNLPLITSCCPGWVKYCETYAPEYLHHLSTAKSPQQMFGSVIKHVFAEKEGVLPEKICSVSVMPCTAKKYERARPEMAGDVDVVITVQELARMIRSAGIDFNNLADMPFDEPFGLGSGAAQIFGITGGVMEAALRTVAEVVTGKELEKLEFYDVRGFAGLKEATVDLDGTQVQVAVVHGLANAKVLIDRMRTEQLPYHFIEVMACPGGCIGGGGNSPTTRAKLEARREAIYREDQSLPLRKSHLNPYVTCLYDEYLGAPLSERSHQWLHTSYMSRKDLLG